MVLYWDAAPGAVRKYIVTYTPEEGDTKEVSSSVSSSGIAKREANVELWFDWSLTVHIFPDKDIKQDVASLFF